MRSRSLILVLALAVLAIGAVGAAQRDAGRHDGKPASTAGTTTQSSTVAATPATTSTSTTTTTAPATTDAAGESGGVEANVVSGTLPADRVVKATVGDVVDVHVTSAQPDIVEVLTLGLSSSVGPEIPATLSFVADGPGRFPVTYEVAGKEAGVIEVTE